MPAMESPSRYRSSNTSPTSPARQIPKSAFFRAKSPQTDEASVNLQTLASPQATLGHSQSPVESQEKLPRLPSSFSGGHQNRQLDEQQHHPVGSTYAVSSSESLRIPPVNRSYSHDDRGGKPDAMGRPGTSKQMEPYATASASTHTSSASDQMLMSLLAGQAAVDCQAMPIGRWEEVEEWKNVSSRNFYRHGILARGSSSVCLSRNWPC
jgi:hypothetical protein